MHLSYKWLKEYIDFDLSPQELADTLTGSGLEVEGIRALGQEVQGTVVAFVEASGQHPDADKLSLCKLTDGQESYQVVCGAANVAAGQKVILAKPGALLPGNFKIKTSKLRGVESQGMICSAKELGIAPELLLPEQKEGILVLAEDAPLGVDGAQYLHMDDYILEIDLTPDRGDCLSIINIARQLAAVLDKKVKEPEIVCKNIIENSDKKIDIRIEDKDACPRYVGKIVEGVTIAPSPLWMQARLRSAGMRPINNVVDVTNYVLLEMGQPLHAFDYDMLSGKEIIVRKAQDGEKIVTLDSQERKLDKEMLLICDGQRPVAIAGVMGAENSEVTRETKDVMIESAYFDPQSVRKTATKLGLRSEASIRFEKGINYDQTKKAAQRAAQLLEEIAGGKVQKTELDLYPNPIKNAQVELVFDRVNKLLGTDLSHETMLDILERLNLELLSKDEKKALFKIPAYRHDLLIEEDLIEEIACIYGLENIPTTLPYGDTNPGGRNQRQKTIKKIKEVLASCGANEVINYSFINRSHLDKILLPENDVRRKTIDLLNPLSEEQAIMRTTLVPGMLENVLRNYNRRSEDLLIFEQGKVFYKNGFPEKSSLPEEPNRLALLGRGHAANDWKNKKEEIDFYYMKGILQRLFASLRIKDIEYLPVSEAPEYHPGRTARITAAGDFIAFLGEVNPKVADNYDIPGRTFIAEIDLDKLLEHASEDFDFKYLPKYPGINRDLAILVDDQIRAGQLIDSIEKNGGKLLVNTEIFDLYQGGQIPSGKKSIAFSLRFQADDKTLTDADVGLLMDKIKNGLESEFAAKLRD